MFVFIDESGDTGFKFEKASSNYFIMTMVLFENVEDLKNCERKMLALRNQLGLKKDFEFHFAHNTKTQRMSLLNIIDELSFTYYVVIIDKRKIDDRDKTWMNRSQFYKHACRLLFGEVEVFLKNAIVMIDEVGSTVFLAELRKYVRENMRKGMVKKFRQYNSKGSDALQIADMICGVMRMKAEKKSGWQKFYELIRKKEGRVVSCP